MRNAIITGSEGQLGKIFISELLKLNYNVIGIDIEKKSNNNKIKYIKADITNTDELKEKLNNKVIENVDVLINNAGVSVFSPFEERTDRELDYVLNVNLKAPIVLSQIIFNNFFKPQKRGCIVNIASIYGLVSGDMRIYAKGDRRTPEIYGASKAGVINLTKYFAAYMAPFNVRVNSISPGGIFNHQEKNFVERYSNKVPLNRMARAEELQSSLRFLIDEDSSYLTGENIVVDGGFTSL